MATVDELITNAQGYAQDAFDQTERLLSAAVNASRSHRYGNAPNVAYSPRTLSPLELPTFETNITFEEYDPPEPPEGEGDGEEGDEETVDTGPERPGFYGLRLPSLPDISTFVGAPPTDLFLYDKPEGIFEFSKDAPNIDLGGGAPRAPDLNYPDAPEVRAFTAREVSAPDVPEYTAFDYQMGDLEGDPRDLEGEARTDYVNVSVEVRTYIEEQTDSYILKHAPQYFEMVEKLDARIHDAIDPNNTARKILPAAVEAELIEQAKSRIADERRLAQEELTKELTRTGFPIPPGLLGASLTRIQTDSLKASIDAMRDAYLTVHERESQHYQAMLQLAAGARDQTRNAVTSYVSTVLDTEKFALDRVLRINELGFKMHGLLVERFRLKYEFFKAQIENWETLMKVAMADLELYKLEMEAQKERTEVDKLVAEIYQVRVAAEKSKIDNYNAQIQARVAELEREKLKLQAFGEEVKAYSAQAEAKRYEFDGYRASLEADRAKVEVYRAQIDAHKGHLEAASIVAAAQKTVADVIIEHNRSLADLYETDLKRYLAEGENQLSATKTKATVFTALLEKYKADLLAVSEDNKLQLANEELALKAALGSLEAQLEEYKISTSTYRDRIKTQADTAIEAAKVMGATAEAALSSQNTLVQLYTEQSQT